MARFFKVKYVLAAIAAVIIVVLLIKQTGWTRKGLTWPEIAVREGVAPAQKGLAYAKTSVGSFFSYFTSLKDLKSKNLNLQVQVNQLNSEYQQLKELKLENHRLHKLLKLDENIASNYDTLAVNIIARDISNWTHTVVIDKGENSGIRPDMTVVNEDGLVGRVWMVTPNTAEVRLIIDRDSAVGALIEDTRLPGVVDGNGEDSVLEMLHIPNDASIEPNQTVVTSGLESIFPKGLRIGYVTKVFPDPDGLTKRAIVQPFANFQKMEDAMVILRVKRGE